MPIEIDTDDGPKKGVTGGWYGDTTSPTKKSVQEKPVEETSKSQPTEKNQQVEEEKED